MFSMELSYPSQKAYLRLLWVWIRTFVPKNLDFGSDQNPIELELWSYPKSEFGTSPSTEN